MLISKINLVRQVVDMCDLIIADILLVGCVGIIYILDGFEFTVFAIFRIRVFLLLVGDFSFLKVCLLEMIIAIVWILGFWGFAGVRSGSNLSVGRRNFNSHSHLRSWNHVEVHMLGELYAMLNERSPDLFILHLAQVLLLEVFSSHYRHQQLCLISLILRLLSSVGCK